MEILMVVAVTLAIPALQFSIYILASVANYTDYLIEEVRRQREDDEPFDLLGIIVKADRGKE
jgi:hypothetical protein